MTDPQPLLAPGLTRALRELLFAPAAVTEDGAGVNLVQALVDLTAAADRLAKAIETFRRDQT